MVGQISFCTITLFYFENVLNISKRILIRRNRVFFLESLHLFRFIIYEIGTRENKKQPCTIIFLSKNIEISTKLPYTPFVKAGFQLLSLSHVLGSIWGLGAKIYFPLHLIKYLICLIVLVLVVSNNCYKVVQSEPKFVMFMADRN